MLSTDESLWWQGIRNSTEVVCSGLRWCTFGGLSEERQACYMADAGRRRLGIAKMERVGTGRRPEIREGHLAEV